MVRLNTKLLQYIKSDMRKTSDKKTFHFETDLVTAFACFEPAYSGQGFSDCLLNISSFPEGLTAPWARLNLKLLGGSCISVVYIIFVLVPCCPSLAMCSQIYGGGACIYIRAWATCTDEAKDGF